MKTQTVVGLIVLTAACTYFFRPKTHHYQPTKIDGVVLDTGTGIECSTRFSLKWSDEDKKAVWAAGLAAKKAETEYRAFGPNAKGYIDLSAGLDSGSLPYPVAIGSSCGVFSKNAQVKECDDLFSTMQDADLKYNALVEKAGNEKVPDLNSTYLKNFPLCKDVR